MEVNAKLKRITEPRQKTFDSKLPAFSRQNKTPWAIFLGISLGMAAALFMFSSCGDETLEDSKTENPGSTISSMGTESLSSQSVMADASTQSGFPSSVGESTDSATSTDSDNHVKVLPPDRSADYLRNITSSRYGYFKLSADEKQVYDQLCDAAANWEEKEIYLERPLNDQQVERVFQILLVEEKDLYYLDKKYFTYTSGDMVEYVKLCYIWDPWKVAEMNDAAEKRAAAILALITDDMPVVDKLLTFHNQIIRNCSYDTESEYAATPYGALVEGKALCEGYARAFAMLCNKAGIENCFALGKIYSSASKQMEHHMWNMVKVKGDWYHMDLTNDDPPFTDTGEALPDNYVMYTFFLVPDYWLGSIEISTEWYTPPAATAIDCNYFVWYGYYASDYPSCYERLRTAVVRTLENRYTYVNFRLSDKELFEYATTRLFTRPTMEILGNDFNPQSVQLEDIRCRLIEQYNIFQLEFIYKK